MDGGVGEGANTIWQCNIELVWFTKINSITKTRVASFFKLFPKRKFNKNEFYHYNATKLTKEFLYFKKWQFWK